MMKLLSLTDEGMEMVSGESVGCLIDEGVEMVSGESVWVLDR